MEIKSSIWCYRKEGSYASWRRGRYCLGNGQWLTVSLEALPSWPHAGPQPPRLRNQTLSLPRENSLLPDRTVSPYQYHRTEQKSECQIMTWQCSRCQYIDSTDRTSVPTPSGSYLEAYVAHNATVRRPLGEQRIRTEGISWFWHSVERTEVSRSMHLPRRHRLLWARGAPSAAGSSFTLGQY